MYCLSEFIGVVLQLLQGPTLIYIYLYIYTKISKLRMEQKMEQIKMEQRMEQREDENIESFIGQYEKQFKDKNINKPKRLINQITKFICKKLIDEQKNQINKSLQLGFWRYIHEELSNNNCQLFSTNAKHDQNKFICLLMIESMEFTSKKKQAIRLIERVVQKVCREYNDKRWYTKFFAALSLITENNQTIDEDKAKQLSKAIRQIGYTQKKDNLIALNIISKIVQTRNRLQELSNTIKNRLQTKSCSYLLLNSRQIPYFKYFLKIRQYGLIGQSLYLLYLIKVSEKFQEIHEQAEQQLQQLIRFYQIKNEDQMHQQQMGANQNTNSKIDQQINLKLQKIETQISSELQIRTGQQQYQPLYNKRRKMILQIHFKGSSKLIKGDFQRIGLQELRNHLEYKWLSRQIQQQLQIALKQLQKYQQHNQQ